MLKIWLPQPKRLPTPALLACQEKCSGQRHLAITIYITFLFYCYYNQINMFSIEKLID